MSKIVNVHAAKTHLSELLDEVSLGEEIIIARAGVPVARLVALESAEQRRPGAWHGKVRIGPDFDLPLPADIAAKFGI
jgi:prevent-host-death family protein